MSARPHALRFAGYAALFDRRDAARDTIRPGAFVRTLAARACGFAEADMPVRPGDAVLARTAPCQAHLLVAATGGGFIHAHARLKRVVRLDGPLDWPVIDHWRLAAAN